MAIAGTRARLVTFEPTGPITARNVQDAIGEAAGGGGGGGGVSSEAVTLTAAEIRDAANTPVTVVSAAGAGTAVIPIMMSAQRLSGTEAFDNGDLHWAYGQLTPITTLAVLGNVFGYDTVFAAQIPATAGVEAADLVDIDNLPVTVGLSSESVAGDRVIRITTVYATVDVS